MKTILIVEDDRILRENTAAFLTEEGYKVLTAEDGMSAIQIVLKSLPDLILCDIAMPNMNGYEFHQFIQQINHTSTIPFVFLTAKAEKEDIRLGMRLGVDDYITKPFDLNELLKVIQIRIEKHEKFEKKSDDKFQALAQSPVIGTFIFQKDSFIFYNEALSEIFGFTFNEFSLLNFEDIIDDKYKTEVFLKIEKCIQEINSSVQLEFEAVHKTKENLSIEMYGRSINYKGIPSIIGNMVDLGKEIKNLSNTHIKIDNSDGLTKREMEVLKLICKAYTTHQVSEKLFISERTVESHRAKLLTKSGCKNLAELIIYANKRNLNI